MANIIEYKCPNCNGALAFDSTLQKLKCPFCESTYDVEELSSEDQILDQTADNTAGWYDPEENTWADGETDGLYTYICRSCGGEIVGDNTLAATSCPYCGNPVVMAGAFTGKLKPDYIIPFKYDKNAAMQALKKHLENKRLLPKVFKEENRIKEIKGMYVPFWLFDADVEGSFTYRTTKSDRREDDYYIYEETHHYRVERNGNISFRKVPVDGSRKISDELTESIEPYDYRELTEFKTPYLAGYIAEKFDIKDEDRRERAEERIYTSTGASFFRTVTGYNTVKQESGNAQYEKQSAKYALLPMWLLNTVWEGKTYTFAMNGQTGRFVGNLPADSGKYRKWLFLLGLGIGLGLFLLAKLFIS